MARIVGLVDALDERADASRNTADYYCQHSESTNDCRWFGYLIENVHATIVPRGEA